MDRRERINRQAAKEDLVDNIVKIYGREPRDIRLVLTLLSHDDLIDEVVDYLQGAKIVEHVCVVYPEGGWSCSQEYEAKLETIWSGRYLGAEASSEAFYELWCEPCRRQHEESLED